MFYFLIVLSIVLALIGIVGAVVPGIAGTPFSFLALLALSFVKGINYSTEFLVIMGVIGAIVFAVDLMKQLDFPCRISCVKISSYSGTESTGTINSLIGLNEDIRGKRILILEDIVDTGRTYVHLHQMLTEAGAKDVRIATMTMKPDAYKADLPVHYVGFNIPNKFVVGRGLDYDGYGRNLPDIYQVVTD